MLTEAMGGTIWVESHGIAGEGSEFHIKLPQEPAYDFDTSLPVTQKRSALSKAGFRAGRTRLAIAAVIVCLVGALLLVQNHATSSPPISGTAHFFNANGGNSNGLRLSATGLAAPPAGYHYQTWLIDKTSEHILSLGRLQSQGHSFMLVFNDQIPTTNLLGLGNEIEITQEHADSDLPLGKVVLSGAFPPNAFIHIRHLLLDFPATPDNKGLLIGLAQQAQLLDQLAQELQSDTQQTPLLAHCVALNMVAIVEGNHGQHAQPQSTACLALHVSNGDGYGLLPSPKATAPGSGYLDGASDHVALALQQSDATSSMHDVGTKVITSLTMMKAATSLLDDDLVNFLKNADVVQVATLVTLANDMYWGEDNAPTSATTPIHTTSGALFAYAAGQLMADLPLHR